MEGGSFCLELQGASLLRQRHVLFGLFRLRGQLFDQGTNRRVVRARQMQDIGLTGAARTSSTRSG